MEFLNNLSLGYQIMLVGISVFILGVVIMFVEGIFGKKSAQKIKEDYLVNNNVRTSENPQIGVNNSIYTNPQVNNTVTNMNQLPNNNLNQNNNVNNNINNNNSNNSLTDFYK